MSGQLQNRSIMDAHIVLPSRRSRQPPKWLVDTDYHASGAEEAGTSLASPEGFSDTVNNNAEEPISSESRCVFQNSEPDLNLERDSANGYPPFSSPKRQRTLSARARALGGFKWYLEPEESQVAASGFPVLNLPSELLVRILGLLPLSMVLQASSVCTSFAHATEAVFERHCRARNWLPPRRPRGESAEVKCFPWRFLYRRHACQACGASGEFPVRMDFSGTLAFLVCKKCAATAWVQQRLVKSDLFVDLVGISGKRLLRKGQKLVKVRKPMTSA